ncbi:hypothetical protein [Flammeovirga kamogawensis]|uniref:Uncharacterized protein n=1 Tax=Flammeovirga kamogawensis TaxID=373891 RepID=A0ABX8GZR6_9BACT|nr:hypothetical protein [Flammeovirga kamogawensis]MBB6459357.1 hypothetical protein [Flammeovirga kamogawensis]QWG08914.1 hypothetical protein KM029_08215 [Flammeovirga kamogawensis]TRX67205.1 hypothetical protein EO216_03260 [Flammeovirga kamogawensis]
MENIELDKIIQCFKTFKESQVIFTSSEGEIVVPRSEDEAFLLSEKGHTAIFRDDYSKDLGFDGLGLFY